MNPEEFARGSWQDSGSAAALPPLEDLRARADRFRRRIVRRNWIEYAAGIVVVVLFAAVALFVPLPALRIGAALVIGGTCVVLWQLRRRGSPLSPMEHGGQLSVLDYQRRELVRQRDALDSIFTWYLLPLVPGMLVILASPLLSLPLAQWEWPPVDAQMAMAFPVFVFVLIYLLNKRAARQLQQQIDEIDALRAA
ncbi:hypothetical protein [Aurantiacibacter gilvus]|uniref:Uncharacterized protein n=1 Tax=Aurantiacibacter gilvus TaxID=3139141 RepID=A0ABU9IEN1_9SPHN